MSCRKREGGSKLDHACKPNQCRTTTTTPVAGALELRAFTSRKASLLAVADLRA
jgi:hypothetical protein